MKSILYTGAALMIGASLYGVVDYSRTKNQNEFKKMYLEEPANVSKGKVSPAPVAVIETKTEDSYPAVKTGKNKNVIKKPEIDSEPGEITYTGEKEEKTEKRNRKLSTKIFSRAPLRDYGEEDTSIILEKKIN